MEFATLDLAAFESSEEPTEAFDEAVWRELERAARWIVPRAGTLCALARGGMTLELLIDFAMDQDQMELILPASLLSACGSAELRTHLISND